MNNEIERYNASQSEKDQKICYLIMDVINRNLAESESKIWHGSPVFGF